MKRVTLPLVLIVVGLIVFSSPAYALGDLSGACGKENAIQLSVYIPGITGVGESDAYGNSCYYLTKFGSSAVGTLPDYIAGLYYFGVTIGGFVAAVMIMIGGVRWVMSGGSPDKISKAKEQMLNATVGLLLLLVSYTIFSIINPNLLRLQLPGGVKTKIGSVGSRDLSTASAMQKTATDVAGWEVWAEQQYSNLKPESLKELRELSERLNQDATQGVKAAADKLSKAIKTYGRDSPEVKTIEQEFLNMQESRKKISGATEKIHKLSSCKYADTGTTLLHEGIKSTLGEGVVGSTVETATNLSPIGLVGGAVRGTYNYFTVRSASECLGG